MVLQLLTTDETALKYNNSHYLISLEKKKTITLFRVSTYFSSFLYKKAKPSKSWKQVIK